MALIFHRFPATETAEAFVAEIELRHGLGGTVYASQDESDRDDPFPWELDPPIVVIDRIDFETYDLDMCVTAERDVEATVTVFGGEFAGT